MSLRCSPAFALTDYAGDVFYRGWTAGCTVLNTGLFLPPFGAVVVDGLSAGQLHHVVVYPPRAHAILDRVCGGYCGLTYSSWTAAGRVLEGPGR